MKKILFATLMFLGVAAVSNAQAPAKTATHKKETTKPANTVSSVSPTTTASTKPATTSSTKAATTEAGKKHKKHHSATKKAPKK